MPKNIKPLDFICIAVFAIAIFFSFLIINNNSSGKLQLAIDSPNGKWLYNLDTDGEFDIQGEIGISHICISNAEAFFEDSPCTNKTCVSTGSISNAGDWAACLPNRIFIRIEGNSKKTYDNEQIDIIAK